MTGDFRNMLYLFGCGALGKEADKETCVNLKRIRELAISQNIWPVVYSAVRPLIEKGEVLLPPDVYSALEKTNFSNIAINIQKTEYTKEILKKLSESGIELCVLKGTTLSRLYAQPETRISSDTDILIKREDEARTSEFLKNNGYDVEEREAHEHHFCAKHKIGGVLEVHVDLIQRSVSDMAFYNKVEYNEPYITVENNIKELGINDGLTYNAAHFIKHFVKKGAGVRHIMDLLLYMKQHEKDADMESFSMLMKELRYHRLIDVAKSVGAIYWGIDFEGFTPLEKSVVDEFLTDVEDGGVFGYDNSNRGYAYRIFSERRTSLSQKEFKKYSVNHFNKSVFRKIFPEAAYMVKIYPEIKQSKIKLFFFHFKRWYKLIKNLLSGKRNMQQYIYSKDENEKSVEAKQRIKLMEELDIIDR